MEMIKHFSHEHYLALCEKKFQALCFRCMKLVSGLAYRCDECKFAIHRSCAELPQEMEHPFHPQHTLTLLAESPYDSEIFECSACGQSRRGYSFQCYECRFDLEVTCAALMPTKNYQPHHNEHQIGQHISHPHPLILCGNKEKKYKFFCSGCKLLIEKDSIYVCLQCKLLLHESCANLQQEIKHPFHPQHPLALLPRAPYDDSGKFQCKACRMIFEGFTYHCSKCKFDLDINCASLMPTTKNYQPDQEQDLIQHFTHPHPLIICDSEKKNLSLSCYACDLPFIKDSIYFCLECMALLHKSCVDLPLELKHPFHPQHPVTLQHHYSSRGCNACWCFIKGWGYECRECDFDIDIRCALPLPTTIKSELHPHPLAFFNIKASKCRCDTCDSPCHAPFFRCVECNFNLHLHCDPTLPPTVRHKGHLHPLTLTHSPIKDRPDEDDDEEFYCDACEEERDLYERSYYCAECHYVAHVECVISEVCLHPILHMKMTLKYIAL